MENKQLVFVYGTLRRNESNHHLVEDATCVAEQAWTTGLLYDTGFEYPALQQDIKGRVYGVLYEINNEQLQKLDDLEGYSGKGKTNFYDRISQTISTDQGVHEAYVYVVDPLKIEMFKTRIDGGDWKVYRLIKQRTLGYFAYGSCMDAARFIKASVNHYFNKVIGIGVLDGYSLRYTIRSFDGGRADIVESGGVVEGKVYEITSEALTYLFRREGVTAVRYRPAVVQVKMADNMVKEVLTFIVVEKEAEVAPPAHYMEEIIRGGQGFLSDEYMKILKNDSQKLWLQKEEDEQ